VRGKSLTEQLNELLQPHREINRDASALNWLTVSPQVWKKSFPRAVGNGARPLKNKTVPTAQNLTEAGLMRPSGTEPLVRIYAETEKRGRRHGTSRNYLSIDEHDFAVCRKLFQAERAESANSQMAIFTSSSPDDADACMAINLRAYSEMEQPAQQHERLTVEDWTIDQRKSWQSKRFHAENWRPRNRWLNDRDESPWMKSSVSSNWLRRINLPTLCPSPDFIRLLPVNLLPTAKTLPLE